MLLSPQRKTAWKSVFSLYVDYGCKTSVFLFLQISDVYAPLDDGVGSQHFISKSYDATSHFETTCKDVLDIFKRGTGEEFDFSKVKHTLEDQE